MRPRHLTIHSLALVIGMTASTACSSDPSSPTTASTASQSRGGTTGSSSTDSTSTANGGTNHGSDDGDKNGNKNGNGGSNDSTANNNRVRSEITLVAPTTNAPIPGAHGKAKWDARSSRTELEIEVENIPSGTVLTFFVGGTQVGAPQTAGSDDDGEMELKLSTQKGDKLPATVAGATVEVKNATGAVVVSGKF